MLTYRPQRRGQSSLAGYWRRCYGWRWQRLHPTQHPVAKKAQGERAWFIAAARALQRLRDTHRVDNEWVRGYIEWFWSWHSWEGVTEQETVHLAVLHRAVPQYLGWRQRFSYILGHGSIVEIGAQFHPHTSSFPAPWEAE